jgi:hypothetical protein
MPSPPLPLNPPPKLAKPTPENVAKLEAWLDAITAFGPYTSGQPWVFYEELDKYLGPWGASGYLIAYGKKYCMLFHDDAELNQNAVGKAWVRRTLLLLQDAIKKLVLDRFRKGALASLTKEELQQVAFDSHAAAYTEGGLALVAMLSRTLILHVAMIPRKEFIPGTRNFAASWRQVFQTGGILVPQALAVFFSAWALPTHTDVLARAYRQDVFYHQRMMELSDGLRELRRVVEDGRLDHAGTLQKLISLVASTRWPNERLADAAQETLSIMRGRMSMVTTRYRREIDADRRLEPIYRSFDQVAF